VRERWKICTQGKVCTAKNRRGSEGERERGREGERERATQTSTPHCFVISLYYIITSYHHISLSYFITAFTDNILHMI
jgi:hypothetical protein